MVPMLKGLALRRSCRALVVFFVATACLGCQSKEVTTITMDGNGSSVTIPLGSTLIVELDANPSGNYLWEIDRLAQSVLRFEEKRLVTLKQESKFGGNRFRQFKFTAVGAGTTRLEIDFASLMEEDEINSDLDNFNLEVVVIE